MTRVPSIVGLLVLTTSLLWPAGPARAASQGADANSPPAQSWARDPNGVRTRQKQRVTNEQRQAATARAAAKRGPDKKGPTPIGGALGATAAAAAPMPAAGTQPDYYGGVYPNWAWTPVVTKFIDKLPGLAPAGANGLGQYIPLAAADTTTYSGSDHYEIALVQYQEQMHGAARHHVAGLRAAFHERRSRQADSADLPQRFSHHGQRRAGHGRG